MTCGFCGGKKIVTSPNGNLGQCPLCQGTGVDTSAGIPFWYNLEVLAVAGNAQSNGNNIIVNNGDFTALFLMASSTPVAPAVSFKCLWSDKGKNRPFSEAAIDSRNMFGTALNPMPLLTPYTFKKGAIMSFDITELSGAANNIRITVFGVTTA